MVLIHVFFNNYFNWWRWRWQSILLVAVRWFRRVVVVEKLLAQEQALQALLVHCQSRFCWWNWVKLVEILCGGGGGGGAGAVGGKHGVSGGDGGAGVATTISGSSVTYAGGGGGGQLSS
jgi:hypothetical protein